MNGLGVALNPAVNGIELRKNGFTCWILPKVCACWKATSRRVLASDREDPESKAHSRYTYVIKVTSETLSLEFLTEL